MARDLMTALQRQVLVCQGPMETALASCGVTPRNAAEATLSQPAAVMEAHQAYLQAGANLLQTNTASAHPVTLEREGLADLAPLAWSEAVRLCRRAAGPDGLVAAVGGPASGGAPGSLPDLQDVRAGFRRQFEAMLGPEVDCVLLRGFHALKEAEAAVQAVRDCDLNIPVAVTVIFTARAGRTVEGLDGAEVSRRLCRLNVQVVGAACGSPVALETAFRSMAESADRPLMAVPGAALADPDPEAVHAPPTPAEVGQMSARLIACGAGIVGAGCGTGPEHVAHIARAAAALA